MVLIHHVDHKTFFKGSCTALLFFSEFFCLMQNLKNHLAEQKRCFLVLHLFFKIAEPWEEVMNNLMNTLKLESRYKSKIIFVHDVNQAAQKIVRHSNMIKMKENKTKKKGVLPKNWRDLF